MLEAPALTPTTYGPRVKRARERAHLTQRDLAGKTGLSQAHISRTENGAQDLKMNDIISIAAATGSSVAEITGHSPVRDRAVCMGRTTNGAAGDAMREELLFFLELDAALAEDGITLPE